jgi:hypothetical protein
MEKEISYLGKKVNLYKYHSESNNYFNQRMNFLKILESNNVSFKDAVKFSKVWSNIKFKNCKYDVKILNLIKKYDKNI